MWVFDTANFPAASSLTSTWADGCYKSSLLVEAHRVDLGEVRSVWNRRPLPPTASSIHSEQVREWIGAESQHALRCLWSALRDRFWLNPYFEEDKGRLNKWLQASVAHDLGFLTPASIISNEPDDVRAFCERFRNDVVIKPIKRGYLEGEHGDRRVLLTSVLDANDLHRAQGEGISVCPVYVQERVPKRFDIRATVVRDRVLSCQIHSQERADTRIDFRRQFAGEHLVCHRPHDLPAKVHEQCIALIERLGPHFGALDLVLRPDGDYVFLEVNPNGQWGWIEKASGLPIAAAIADTLISSAMQSP